MSNTYHTAVNMQRMAADPAHSVFVSANAGSGKTRVLVERVSRLLLDGAMPDKILCLTYTKAAAAEMQSRLFDALGEWSILSAEKLTDALNTLEDKTRPRSTKELGRARRLFARALETPGGLKVQTIHGFCEKLLRRFPLEAGIAPGSDALSDSQSARLLAVIIKHIQTNALGKECELSRAITLLSAQKNDADMDALYGWATHNAYKIEAWKNAGGTKALAKHLDIPHGLTVDAAAQEAWEQADIDHIRTCAQDLLASTSVTDKKRGALVFDCLENMDKAQAFHDYLGVFFKDKGAGDPFAAIVTKQGSANAQSYFGKKGELGPEALRMLAARERVKRAGVLELTGAVYTLVCEVAAKYQALKIQMRVIDFNDQIELARRLLLDTQASDWVRYKLDGGVDHILVDEAQDTSLAQWDIVGAMSDPFFQPSPDEDRKNPRTLFAVGDEKQSIYSFQGARPELFLDKIQSLTTKQADTPEVKMSMSFRSAQEILDLVDEGFYRQGWIKETFDADSFPPGSDIGEHIAHRDDPGLIEFWPAVPTPDAPEAETASKPVPVDTPSQQSAREQLARQIAIQVKSWLDNQETICIRRKNKPSIKRPMQARDVLILVTKRGGFFDAVIRNLKEQNVPVAGADRLQLIASIAVQDLLSLAKFTLLPSDDLSLAEVLKSPLIGMSEDELFNVAANRKGSLWSNIPKGKTRDILTHLKSLANKYAPYEFFARTLSYVPNSGGDSLLQRFYTRLGHEIADGIEAFLAQSLAHQRQGAPSLTRFVADIERGKTEIKREMDAVENEVRVMTVHGAKGLEAPVVILPDTTQVKKPSKEFLYALDNGGFIAVPPTNTRPEIIKTHQLRKQAQIDQEAMRLLYVALTRAETRLLICGFESNKQVADNSWHAKTQAALQAMGAQNFETEFGQGLRYGGGLADYNADESGQDTSGKCLEELPIWARQHVVAAKPHSPSLQFLSPSALVGPDEEQASDGLAVRSPLWARGEEGQTPNRFARGIHIHKLLQVLPELEISARRKTAKTYLQGQSEITENAKTQIEQEVFAVLEHKDFAPFFAKTDSGISAAEVSLVGGAKHLPDHIRFSGQIDRLCVVDGVVWILDYKSNRPPPKHEDDVAPIYIRQLAAYRALAQEIFKGLPVRCALLWTDGPHLMEVSDTVLDNVQWEMVLPS